MLSIAQLSSLFSVAHVEQMETNRLTREHGAMMVLILEAPSLPEVHGVLSTPNDSNEMCEEPEEAPVGPSHERASWESDGRSTEATHLDTTQL